MKRQTLRQAADNAADLLDDFVEALSGRGKLINRSLHLRTGKWYTTLARDFAKAIREAEDPTADLVEALEEIADRTRPALTPEQRMKDRRPIALYQLAKAALAKVKGKNS